jgi:CheY-like chemotaxis protein
MLRNVPPGRYVLLEVTDAGCGIPAEVRERIFEAFFTTKAVGEGTGLGLSTVMTIVRAHGGSVQVESETGRGSTFKVYLPAQREPLSAQVGKSAAAPPPRGRNQLILSMTQQTLETYGYRVLRAEDGAHAIALFAQHQAEIALVMLDMMMPVMDGPALIKALRRIDPKVKIIATSGLQSIEDSPAVAGVRHFIVKPFSGEVMLETIARALAD